MSCPLQQLIEVNHVGVRVTAYLKRFLAQQLATAVSGSHERALMGPVADLILGGGKRLRPALCYWGWRAGGGLDADEPIAAAAAVEMLHALALIHDDVMDHSTTRRARPAVHVHFRDEHAGSGWRGSSDDFGAAAAILAGDLCLVWADMILNDSDLYPAARRRGAAVYDQMRRDAICGQFLDLVGQASGACDPALSSAIAVGKTASSTTVGPLLFGAELAGAPGSVTGALRAYAEPLGIAFQLHDDLLDSFGDPSATGKPVGQDLRDGKSTRLLVLARRLGGRETAACIDRLIEAGDEQASTQLRELLDNTGARAQVEREIALLTETAIRALKGCPLSSDTHAMFNRLARAVTEHSTAQPGATTVAEVVA